MARFKIILMCWRSNINKNKDNSSAFPEEKIDLTSAADHVTMEAALEVQNLVAKVEALEKLVRSTKTSIDEERLQSAASLESARREIEDLKLKLSHDREEKQGSETSSGKHGMVIKDIELDQISNSCSISRIQSSETDEQMVKMWEDSEREFSDHLSVGHDIEAVQELKSRKPSSELVSQKKPSFDRLEMSTEIKVQLEDWSRRFFERLAYDSKKLSVLQANARELTAKMDSLRNNSGHYSMEHANLMLMMRGAEEAISELVESNGNLSKNIESHTKSAHVEEMRGAERRKVLERARRESDKIGMLELELEKIHYIFLKLEEEHENHNSGRGDRTPRVLLRDYLYGRKVKQGKKRNHFCRCMRPTARE